MERLDFEEGEVLRVGAESVIKAVRWRGLELVRKHRIPKKYRRPEIDERIRRSRTIHEAKTIVTLSENGVPVPLLIFLDIAGSSIYMQRIVGVEMRDYLVDGVDFSGAAYELGRITGLTHSLKISHGDLTLSNILVAENGKMWLIDFGLSLFNATLEDLAVDLHLLGRSLESTHPSLHRRFMEMFMSGYSEVAGSAQLSKIMEKVAEIRRRGRYVVRAGT
ncbi:3-deoxy-D-manno-octulosonic acid kinase [archaeon HR01]|nr:3-deoxy-D-manno-octulosonic acid kinase [archaeon HR01]